MRALVTGASGHIGSNIVRALCAGGHGVRALVRRNSDRRGLADLPIDLVVGDILDRESLDEALRGADVDVVFHAAANFAIWARREADILRPSLEGTRNVFEAARHAGVRRIVHLSSSLTVGFGDGPEPLRTERDFRGAAHLAYYRAKTEGERLAHELGATNGVPVVTLCPTLVLGAWDFRTTPSMRPVLDMANGSGPTLEGGANIVSARDVARAALLAAERGRAGERYLVGGDNVTLKELGALVAAWTGRTPKHVALPRWAFLTMATLAELGATLTGRAPALTRAAVRDVVGKWAFFDCSKAARELGFEAAGAEAVIAETMTFWLEHGFLGRAVAERVREHARRAPDTALAAS